MDVNLQPKLPLNQELLYARYGHNHRRVGKFLVTLQTKYEVCQESCLARKHYRKSRENVCEYCTRADCMIKELTADISGTDLMQVRCMIGFLKQYGMFSYEDYALVNPDVTAMCKEKEDKIKLLEDEIRKKYGVEYFLYRDLFSATSKEFGGINKSPYEIRLLLWIRLVEMFPAYYEGMQECLKKYYAIYDACMEASKKIPNFYKVIFAEVYGRSWNIYFEGLHPIMISKLINKFNEAEAGSLEVFFSRLGYSPSDIFEKMDKYEVKNMEFFHGVKISKKLLEKYDAYSAKKKYPVIYAFVKKRLEGEV